MVSEKDLEKLKETFGFLLAQELAKAAPRKTSRLAKSFPATMKTTKDGIEFMIPEYGMYIEYGTGIYGPSGQPIEIKPKDKKALMWKGAKHPVKKVINPGIKANPFMRRTLNEKGKQILQKAIDIITKK